ncbi:PREDICTED: serine/threonine-protein kinase-like protein CCR4 [Populus euphratica]|uniref:Serine/threonine-protein kinase-like protein CCR4 n=1 Tax=Populus euphratica TaxID=75702 RepID=A0AAJ6X4V6_POPEU|nr:PREDICTED: serine/threonine-protein kinase-like protein CCR4 [Populus euphratica]
MACDLFNLHVFSYLIFLSPFIPFVFSLSTVSISEISNQTLVCALTPARGTKQDSFLSCSSFPRGIQIPLNPPSTSFSAIVGGKGFLCGLISLPWSPTNSTLVCWRFSVNATNMMSYKRIYHDLALSQLEAGKSFACGLINVTNHLECWPRREFNSSSIAQGLSSIAVGEDFVCGISESGSITCGGSINNAFDGQNLKGNYCAVAAGFRHACAINSHHRMECWGSMVGEKPEGEFISMALGENRGCALRTNGTIVCWGQDNFSLPERLKKTYFIAIEATINVFCGVEKSTSSLYCWGNEIFNSNLLVFEEVLPGPRRNDCPDAISGPQCQSVFPHSKSNSNCTPPPAIWPPTPEPRQERLRSCNKWSDKIMAFFVVGCGGSLVLLLVIGFFLFKYCKCRGCRIHDSGRLDGAGPGADVEQGGAPSRPQAPRTEQASPVLEKRLSELASMGNAGHLEEFSFQVLLEATNNFSPDKKIGAGCFGSVYQGTLDDGCEVAIKRAEISNTYSYSVGTKRQEDRDVAFINELESLSRLHHKNLVKLLGFCEDSNELVLVYEYMHNGTLFDHLHKLESSPLMSWTARIKVALDAARGVEYLHRYAVPPIIHRDIKSSNILLDSTWTAKVSDFGLCLMGPEDEKSHLSLLAAGTVGYMDPEYYILQRLSTKSDVYSFGVVLMEILSGYKAIHKNENGVHRNVVDLVVPSIVQEEIHRVLDSRVPPPTPFEIEAVIRTGYLAADCVTLEGRDRPSMTDVVSSLDRALAACLPHPSSLSRSTTGSSI